MTKWIMTHFTTALPPELPAGEQGRNRTDDKWSHEGIHRKRIRGDDRSQNDSSPLRVSSDALGRAQHLFLDALHPVMGVSAAIGEVFHEGEDFIAEAADVEDVASVRSLRSGIGG